jgi:hypothetical protein
MNPLSAGAFVFSLLAWASYIPVSKSPRLRRTMWPTVVLIVLALLGDIAIVLSRASGSDRITALDIVTWITAALFVPVYFFALRVPRSGRRPQAGGTLPVVSFIAEDGQAISSAQFIQRGPLLLVFFRGFW